MLLAIFGELGGVPFLALATFVGYLSLKCIPRCQQQMPDWDLLEKETD